MPSCLSRTRTVLASPAPAILRQCLVLGLVFVVVLAVTGCSREDLVFPDQAPTPLDLSRAGKLTGTVFFAGEPPERIELSLSGAPGCAAGHGEATLSETVLVNDGKLENVFVYIQSGLEDRVFAVPREAVVVDQKGCVFLPHVVGAQAHQPVRFLNSDNLLHNVRAAAIKNKGFNFGLDVAGSARVKQFPVPEVPIPLKCDVHGWMTSYVCVVPHPYFAVTGAEGAYVIDKLPPGTYVLEAWHEALGTKRQEVAVAEDGTATVDFTFSAAAND